LSKIIFKSNGGEALSDESLLTRNGDEAISKDSLYKK
jgi:hypothetical protein